MPANNLNGILADCPNCGTEPEAIEYFNCGPIVYLRCPKCKFRLNEDVECNRIGMEALIKAWNQYS